MQGLEDTGNLVYNVTTDVEIRRSFWLTLQNLSYTPVEKEMIDTDPQLAVHGEKTHLLLLPMPKQL